MMKRVFFGAIFASLLVAAVASAAASVTTATGAGADTWIINDPCDGGSNANKGAAATMNYRYLVTSRFRTAYFKFDLSNITGDLTGAALSLQLTYNNGSRVRTLDVYGLDESSADSWSESTITYNNAPGFLPTDPINTGQWIFDTAVTSHLTKLGTITTLGGIGVMSSTVGNLNLDAFLAANTNGLATFVIMPQSSDSNAQFSWATKENTSGAIAPTLVLPNATLIPEPATLAMLGLGGLLFARKKRA